MTQIRPASESDIPRLLEMGEKFYQTTHYPENVAPYDAETVEALIGMMRDGVMLVAEVEGEVVGMVGLVVVPHLFNRNYKTACEIVWWVEPEHRGGGIAMQLMNAIEPAAKDKGAVGIQMALLSSSPPVAAAIYERLGYTHTESSYFKRI